MIKRTNRRTLTHEDLQCQAPDCMNELRSLHGDSWGITTTDGIRVCFQCWVEDDHEALPGQGPGRFIQIRALPTQNDKE